MATHNPSPRPDKPAATTSHAVRPDDPDDLVVTGAREHNLKGITVRVPKHRLVVFTGVSGSGKSSLAFDTLYAEGQRRYVESLSAYARQFLGRLERPRYETIRGLSPTIAIEQRTSSANPRSTVATITEIADYLRVLFARTGVPHCPDCGRPVESQSAQAIVGQIAALPAGSVVQLLAPLIEARKGEHRETLDDARQAGFTRVRLDGAVHRLDALPELDPKRKHTVELVVDRVTIKPGQNERLTDSIETALKAGSGLIRIAIEGQDDRLLSERSACADCGTSLPELTPPLFSWNAPHGMCGGCQGLGHRFEVDPERVVKDPTRSIQDGAVPLLNGGVGGPMKSVVEAALKAFAIDPTVPFAKLAAGKRKRLLYGADKALDVKFSSEKIEGRWTTRWEGVIPRIQRKARETTSESMHRYFTSFFSARPCDDCGGQRLNPIARAVQVGGRSLPSVLALPVQDAARFFDELDLPGARAAIAADLLREVRARLRFLLDVGLGYLTLDRAGPTLSGGEAQRIRLASQVGSELTGVLYVLDEPSVGLHPRDTARLLKTLARLRDLGNTVLVVEHDEETIRAADYLVDFGPGAGVHGGEVVAAGTPHEVAAASTSLTGAYLAGRERIHGPGERRSARGELVLAGATLNNLRGDDIVFPLGCLVAVTGVSGAGKSSLINGTLEPLLAAKLMNARRQPGPYRSLTGLEHLDKLVAIDQRPIGLTPRSNPATYVKVFDEIRRVFSALPEARAFGFAPGRFSFNVKGGRCEACQGGGVVKVEMHFLPDVWVGCDLCEGRRFNDATLRVRFKGKTIADVLELTVAEALELFTHQPRVVRPLTTLLDVGLGYLRLGQASTTLSGGEAQRVKLSRELARTDTGRTLYILDEPTTGLHFDDVRRLLTVLQRLVEVGNSVVVIEHNLDVIRCADHVIDIGPEGGAGGGRLIASGTPEAIAICAGSYTGQALAAVLGARGPDSGG